LEFIMITFYISRRRFTSDPFKVVYREVKTRTRKGYPLTYELKALAGDYQTWEEAQSAISGLSPEPSPAIQTAATCPLWPW
jgi:hypothetical protein